MKILKKIRQISCVILLASMFCSIVAAEAGRSITISGLIGNAEVKSAKEEKIVPAKVGMLLYEGDTIITKASSTAVLELDGKEGTATIEVSENSQLLMAELAVSGQQNKQTLLELEVGKILIKAQKLYDPNSRFEVKTPTSIVGVRGTIFSVEVEPVE